MVLTLQCVRARQRTVNIHCWSADLIKASGEREREGSLHKHSWIGSYVIRHCVVWSALKGQKVKTRELF